MEVVLFIAGKYDDLVAGAEVDQADRAIRHICIFLLVLFMRHLLETVHVAFE